MRRVLQAVIVLLSLVASSDALCSRAWAGQAASVTVEAERTAEGLLAVPPFAPVVDLASVLTPAQRQQLLAQLGAVAAAYGAQIAVLTVATTAPETIEQLSLRVAQTWRPGRKDVGDGVLIVIAVEDRRVRIEVGKALRAAITDEVAAQILSERVIVRLREAEYHAGLTAAVDGLTERIQTAGLPRPARLGDEPGSSAGNMALMLVLAALAVVALVAAVFIVRKARR